MRTRLSFSIGLFLCVAGCGGNVTVGAGGAGGEGGGTTSAPTGGSGSTVSTTTSTGTGTAPGDFAACNGPGQCLLATATCCGPCGFPELPDYVAVHNDKAMAYYESLCPDPVACPDCITGYDPHLFAYCDLAAGKCVGADARTHAVSACTSADQCYLRGGASCCESCNELTQGELTALSTFADPSLVELVCNPDAPCPPCAPSYPAGAQATCGPDGHCSVLVLDM
jgi:hypothetical protein